MTPETKVGSGLYSSNTTETQTGDIPPGVFHSPTTVQLAFTQHF